MDYWQHARLSAKKFGGAPEDYLAVHRFLDSGKLFRYDLKHRLLLHNLYGVELAMGLFGDCIENSERKIVLVRDIAHAHCREDLAGRVPSLREWLEGVHGIDDLIPSELPVMTNPALQTFLWKPYLRSGIDASLAITFSDFGIYLVESCLGAEARLELAHRLRPLPPIGRLLDAFVFEHDWQYSPRQSEILWLSNHKPTSA